MTPDELEDLAIQRAPMPELRSQADVLLFQAFRNLYEFAGRVGMSPEQGKREKAEILNAYHINKTLEDMQEATNKMWARIERAAAEYAKNPSVETADLFYKAVFRAERKKAK